MSSPAMDFDERAISCPLCGGAIYAWGNKSRGGHAYQYDRCHQCDFAFVNPRPTEAALNRYYSANISEVSEPSDDTSDAHPASLDANSPLPPWPLEAIRQMLAIRPGPGDFLDVGAGGGVFTLAALRAGLRPTSLELDRNDADLLRTVPGVTVAEVSVEQFASPAESFDYILMSHVLEHAHDPDAWVKKSAELLRPGGVLAIFLPHFNSIYRLIGGTRDRYFFPPEHLNHFNIKSLNALCKKHGLKSDHAYTEGRFPADMITRRVSLPTPLSNLVQLLTNAASAGVEALTRASGCGGVLILMAQKPVNW